MKTKKVPVTERALFARVDRTLRKRGEMLRRSRVGSTRALLDVGRYYVLDVDRGAVVGHNINLEKYARELGVMQDFESLVDA